jgi:N-acetylneuraminic acid mutarotase
MKVNYSFHKIALVIATITATILLTTSFVSAQSWYDANWSYRRAITVTNTGSVILTDYQVKISLNSSFDFLKTNIDGSDIRITSDDGTTEIPFWIAEWTSGTEAVIWAKMPSLPTSGATIYVYYGNPGATSVSDGTSTFRLFEDFENWNSSAVTGWTDKEMLPASIADQTAAVYDGKLYSIGGYGSGPTDPVANNYEYNPVTNTWAAKASMPTARWGMVSVELDGKIYVFGGAVNVYTEPGSTKNEVYDPTTDTWDVTKSNIPEGLAGMGIMGVRYGTKIHLFRYANHYEYDPANDTYTQKADVPQPRVWSTCANVGSKIYILGGDNGDYATSTNQVYDLATDTWSLKASMPDGLWGATRENPVIDGKIYVTHGLDGGAFYTTNYRYDPVANTWETKSSAVHARDGAACGVINNKLYVVGGRADFSGPFGLSYNEVYDPLMDVPPGFNLWTTSSQNFVYSSASAKYKGNNGLVVEQKSNNPVEQFLQSKEGLGSSYAVDFEWNMTDSLGIGAEPRPQGLITLSETDPDGSVYLYNSSNVPSLDWYNGTFQHLQNTTWNNWHRTTIVKNGANSSVTFDGISHSPLAGYVGGTGKIKFGVYFDTKQYLDNVRVRKWSGIDPPTVVGIEQHLAPPAAPVLIAPANASLGVSSSANFVWNPSETAISYHLQLSNAPNFVFVYNLSGITTTSATVSGLVNNTTYYWRVNASNDRESGDWSEVWSFTTCANPPTINAGQDQTVCTSGGAVTMAGFSYTNASGAIWSGGSGSWNGNVYTPVAADFSAGTITLTYSTNTSAPCGDVSDNMILTFIPAPEVTWTAGLTSQCVSSTTYSLSGGLPEGGTYSGTGVTGNNFDASIAGAGVHSLTYSYTNPTTLCTSSAANNITVIPLPTIVTGTYGPVCIDAAEITLGGIPEGGVWTGGGVSGTGPYVFSPSAGTQTLTYTYTDGATSCVNSAPVTITVNPLPSVSAGTYGPTCIDAADITLEGSPAGGVWAGTGVSGTGPYVFDPSAGTQTLTYTYSDGITSCVNTASATITVNPLPTVDGGEYGPVCMNAPDITLGGIPAGGVWTGTGISGTGPYVFDPSSGTQTLNYTYADGITTCENSVRVIIEVLPLPEVIPGTYGPVCVDAADITMGGIPSGGIWTGTGVSGTGPYVFDPSSGTQTLTYTYSDGITSCVNSASATITVNPLPIVSAGTYAPVNINSGTITLVGSPVGGTFSGAGVSGDLFNPALAGLGIHNIVYTFSDVNGCANSDNTTINVLDVDKTLNLNSLLLEGLYNGLGTMRQAFDEFGGPHFTAPTADQITIELHDALNYANIVYSTSAVNLSTSGTATVIVPLVYNGSYYITVKHRNSVETTTAAAVSFAGSTINYSFGNPANVFGGNLGLMIDNYYVVYAGDVNQDGAVDSGDFTPVDNDASAYLSGYLVTDINGDGSVDSGDFTSIDNNGLSYIGTSHP